MSQSQKWICAQLGGREHYAVPRALHGAGALGELLTDYWAGPGTRALAQVFSGPAGRSLAARYHPALASARVKSWNLQTLIGEARRRRIGAVDVAGRYHGYCDIGKGFAEGLVRHWRAQAEMPKPGVFFGYDTASLEAMEYLKARGWACIVDQIDPCRVEAEIVQAEQRTWPGWEAQALAIPEEFFERHLQEWTVADRVVVNSEWSRQALMQQGVPPEKLVVIPLAYEAITETLKPEMLKPEILKAEILKAEMPLRVLFLGQVMLRKGIQYLVEAARLLEHDPVRFEIVGPIHISEKAVASVPPNVVFHGRATRDQIHDWYQGAHVFVLPTLSDGFALTQIEAMANGLPVIATPNCGEVVTDGVDGFIVPPRDPVALARAIRRYLTEPELLIRQRAAAREKVKQFSLAKLTERLMQLEAELVGKKLKS